MARILITGSDGAIAKKLIICLEKKNHKIIDYDLSQGKDILNLKQLESSLKGADLCLHNAAVADLNRSRQAPLESWNINMTGSVNVAHLCSKLNVPVVYISTCCVYGNCKEHPSSEESLPAPAELYAATKLAGEQAFVGYARMYGLTYSIARISTVYGPGMREALVVHTFFKKAIVDEPIIIHGNGKQTRTLTYIDDLIKALAKQIEYTLNWEAKNYRNGEIFNLSTEEEVSVNQIAHQIRDLCGSKSEIIHTEDRPGQIFKEQIDSSKAKKRLKWQAKTSFAAGIKKLYHFFKKEKFYLPKWMFPESKRIFIGFNSAGAPGIYSFTRAMRKRGIKVDFYGMEKINYKMPVDYLLKFSTNPIKGFFERLIFFFKILPKYDVWHFNYTDTLFYPPLNLLLLRLFGKKIISTFRGSDVEDFDYSINKWGIASPFYESELRYRNRRRRRMRMKTFTFLSHRVVLIGPWLIPSVNRYDKIIPYSRDLEKIVSFKTRQPAKNPQKSKIVIFHAPTDPAIKGTKYIKQAYDNLAKKYKNIELRLVEKVPHDEVLRQMAQSDIVVEQLLLNWYSGTAVEAMALGRPVMSFLNPEYFTKMPFSKEIPIFNTNLWSFEKDLEFLICSPELREKLGKEGEKFVQKYHSSEVIAERYLNLYREVI